MSSNKKIEKIKRIALDLPEHKHLEIKLAATSRGMTIKEFVEKALYSFSEILCEEEINEKR